VQYLTHEYHGESEILLMDEPDAFLSGEAQQDLLKVFHMFANPSSGRVQNAVPVQVIYVTHSPFLIDKNHSERVRALEKSEGSKGTRVINSASQNHYEPLRSAFGSFVGETTFISGCNLMVEGPADQILIAGSAHYLRQLEDVPESQLIDLNHITIVPCGGAPNVPYLVYLARGRDSEKPAVIVLLDSDNPGNEAKKNLTKPPHSGRKSIMNSSFILQLGDINIDDVKKIDSKIKRNIKFVDLEDLVPLKLSILAAHKFLQAVYSFSESELAFISEKTVTSTQEAGDSPFKTIQKLLTKHNTDKSTDVNNYAVSIDKVPFARSVIDILPELERKHRNESNRDDGLKEFEINMRALFHRLRSMQSMAEKDIKDKRMRKKVDGKVETFLNDHSISKSVTRDEASRLLTDIESDLEGDDTESTFITQECKKLRATHNLTESLFENVRDFDGFIEGLECLRNAASYCYEDRDNLVPSRRSTDTNKKTSPKKPVNEKMDIIDTASNNTIGDVKDETENQIVEDSEKTTSKSDLISGQVLSKDSM
jgi:hypothetical protein